MKELHSALRFDCNQMGDELKNAYRNDSSNLSRILFGPVFVALRGDLPRGSMVAVARLAGKLDNSVGSAGGIGDTAEHSNGICRSLMGAGNDRIYNNSGKIFLRLDMPVRFPSPVCRFFDQTQKNSTRKNTTQPIPLRTIDQILDPDFSFDDFGARTGNRLHTSTRNQSIAFRDLDFGHIDLDDFQCNSPNGCECQEIRHVVVDSHYGLDVVEHSFSRPPIFTGIYSNRTSGSDFVIVPFDKPCCPATL